MAKYIKKQRNILEAIPNSLIILGIVCIFAILGYLIYISSVRMGLEKDISVVVSTFVAIGFVAIGFVLLSVFSYKDMK